MYKTVFERKKNINTQLSIIIPFRICSINEIIETLNNVCLVENADIILINDGSSQSVVDNVLKYLKNKKNISLYCSLSNYGVSAARNFGLSVSKTTFVTFVDSDDFINPNVVAKSIDLLNKSPDIVFAACKLKYVKSNESLDTDIISKHTRVANSTDVYTNYLYFSNEYTDYSMRSACSKIFRRELIKDFYFDTNLSNFEDSDFMLAVCNKRDNCILIDQTMYFYMMRDNSASHSYKKDLNIQFEYFYNKNIKSNFITCTCDCLYFFLIDIILNDIKNGEKLTLQSVIKKCRIQFIYLAIKDSKFLKKFEINNKFINRIATLSKFRLYFLIELFVFCFCKKNLKIFYENEN